jgi:hypothetical protein
MFRRTRLPWLFGSCSLVIALAAASLRGLVDLVATGAIGDDPSLLSLLCCYTVTPVLVCVALVCAIICTLRMRPDWGAMCSHCLGLILLGAFVYVSLPLVSALLTPMQPAEERQLLNQDCELIRQSTVRYSYEHPGRSQPETSEAWLDIDGDSDLERWEQINAKAGGIGFFGAVFIYEMGEATPRWCGQVEVFNSLSFAWIRPMNLDLDLAPEIWMRDAPYFSQNPWFLGFLRRAGTRIRSTLDNPACPIVFQSTAALGLVHIAQQASG